MRKFTLLLAFFVIVGTTFVHAQKRQISGTVTNTDDGTTLPGVSVVVKGATIGTVTDANGKYSLEVPADAKTLQYTFVGMKMMEVPIGASSIIDVTMEVDALKVEEVVVTAVGIKRSEKALGYSVATVSEDKIAQKAEPDVLRSLKGKVAGVQVNNSSGAPGTATRITIRGNSSFYGDNQPLFVVDGIPYSNQQFNTTDQSSTGGAYGSGISTLDPNDIASVSVLKGAAAAALYGSRAANGVIVIRTKSGNPTKGKKGLEVSYSSSYSTENISNLPDYQNTYGNGVNFSYANANGSWGPRFDSLDSIPLWGMYANAFPEMGDSVPYVAQPNNVKDLFRTGHVFENSVSISGGDEKSAFSLTASALSNDGYIPHSSFDRNSIGLGGSTELDNGLKVGGNFSYSKSTQQGGLFGNNQASDAGTASSFARTLWLGRTWDMSLPYTDPVTGENLTPNGPGQFDNPLWSWEHNKVITNMDRIIGSANIGYDFTDWLSFSYQLGVNTLMQRRQQIVDQGSRAYAGEGAIIDDDIWSQEIESNLLLTIDKDISEDLNIRTILGHNVNQRTTDRQAYIGTVMRVPGIYDLDNTINVSPFGGDFTERRLYGVFADVSMGYKRLLYLNFTGRNDWSSTLPTDKNSYFYPSVSSSFIFTEVFDLPKNIVSFGKIRASWAKTGNDADPYQIHNIYQLRSNKLTDTPVFPFLGIPAMQVPDVAFSSGLKPEFTTEVEVGTDIAFFQNKLRVDFTYYDRKTTDQIVNVKTAASSGYYGRVINAGEIQNKGVEIGLNITPFENPNGFGWNIYTTYTKNNSEVLAIAEGNERMILSGLFGDPQPVFEVGQPYGVLRGTVNYRDDEGNLLIDQQTGLLILDIENATIADPNPGYRVGIANTFSYKGFYMNVLLDYTHGGEFYSNSIASMLGRGVTKDTEDREHSFVIPGFYGDPNTGEALLDEGGNKIPNTTQVSSNNLYFGNSFAINAASEWNIYDATVFRVSEITFGYDLPKKLIDRLPFGGINLSVTGRNLWFYAPGIPEYCNIDPELNTYGATNVQGIEYSAAPSVRRISFNLKVRF